MVVGETSFDECLHIATATWNKVDILVSWNFKHIVNVYRIRGYNSINLRLGLNLNIHSPKEIVGNESKTKTEKDFDTVKTFREIKDKISKEIKGMNFEQFNAFLQGKKLKAKKKINVPPTARLRCLSSTNNEALVTLPAPPMRGNLP